MKKTTKLNSKRFILKTLLNNKETSTKLLFQYADEDGLDVYSPEFRSSLLDLADNETLVVTLRHIYQGHFFNEGCEEYKVNHGTS
jgi:hypothetical protein